MLPKRFNTGRKLINSNNFQGKKKSLDVRMSGRNPTALAVDIYSLVKTRNATTAPTMTKEIKTVFLKSCLR